MRWASKRLPRSPRPSHEKPPPHACCRHIIVPHTTDLPFALPALFAILSFSVSLLASPAPVLACGCLLACLMHVVSTPRLFRPHQTSAHIDLNARSHPFLLVSMLICKNARPGKAARQQKSDAVAAGTQHPVVWQTITTWVNGAAGLGGCTLQGTAGSSPRLIRIVRVYRLPPS